VSIENVLFYRCLCDQYINSELDNSHRVALYRELTVVWNEELTDQEKDDLNSGDVRRGTR
jgi:hypothetical protein